MSLFFFTAIVFPSPLNGQINSGGYFECPEPEEPHFEGDPAPTLCDGFGGISNFDWEIGAGTMHPTSNSLPNVLSGNVKIVGNFVVNDPTVFKDAIVNINPDVLITVNNGGTFDFSTQDLVLDNSKLFACDEMWEGIHLSFGASVWIKNNSVVEDAKDAVYSSSAFTYIGVEESTLNRNIVGINLIGSNGYPSSFGPLVWVFKNNYISCDAPLNGTVDEISEAGVKLQDAYLSTRHDITNQFWDLKYGIYATGEFSFLDGDRFHMVNIRENCIYMEYGFLDLELTNCINCFDTGIKIDNAQNIDINKGYYSVLDDTDAGIIRKGVFIEAFGLNSTVTIEGIDFSHNGQNEVKAIHLKGGMVDANTKVDIQDCTISIHAPKSVGIDLDGNFPKSSSINIRRNIISTGFGGNNGTLRCFGIKSVGDKSKLAIFDNDFEFNGFQNWAIRLYNSTGISNYISENRIVGGYLSSNQFTTGMFIWDFQNTLICSNLNDNGTRTGYWLTGTTAGTSYRANTTYATGRAFWLDGALIGPQSHQGNRWFPKYEIDPFGQLVGLHSNEHTLCEPSSLASLNKFTVHTNQSIFNPLNNTPPFFLYDFFSEYHPEGVFPDAMDEFFGINPSGTPQGACAAPWSAQESNVLDEAIADNEVPNLVENPSLQWLNKAYLYKKLKNYPNLVGQYAGYPMFLNNHSNSSIGKFHAVSDKIEDAFSTSPESGQENDALHIHIQSISDDLQQVDLDIVSTNSESELSALIQQKIQLFDILRQVQSDLSSTMQAHKGHQTHQLIEAQQLNSSIENQEQWETNSKEFNDIYLDFLLSENPQLTGNQVNALISIAEQPNEIGGLAVGYAYSLLPDCARGGLAPEISDPEIEPSSVEVRASGIGDNPPSAFSVYPNPTSSDLSITLGYSNEDGTVFVLDALGNEVFRKNTRKGDTTLRLNSTAFDPGTYIVKSVQSDGTVSIRKLIIQR